MTTYEVENEDSSGHRLTASWPDLPERAGHLVANFRDPKLAAVAKTVLNAASRYRWRRWVQLLDEGVFNEPHATGSASLPALPTGAVLGESGLGAELEEPIRTLIGGSEVAREQASSDSGGFVERVRFGQLGPLLWRDWSGHLRTEERSALAAELDADLAATMGQLTGRARQAAWYLSAELLIDEDHSQLGSKTEQDRDDEGEKAFQGSLVQLLGDLVGLRVESTAIDWDPDNEEFLRVYSPVTVVGFWLDPECWYYGWPDPHSPDGEPTVWQHAGTLPTNTSVGDLAGFIAERTARQVWPFGGSAPTERRSLFGGRS
jgi:hypothetical protein